MNYSPRTSQANFPSIKRTTTAAAGFTLSRGFTSPDLRAPALTQPLMREIEKRIEAQRKDLEQRNVAMRSLLGHFEQIATMCRDEKKKNIEFRSQNTELIKEIKHLKKIIEENNNEGLPRKAKDESLTDLDEYEGVWKENDRLKEVLKRQEKEISERSKEVAALSYNIMNYKIVQTGLEKNIAELEVEAGVAKGVKRKLEDEIFNMKAQVEQLKENIGEYIKQVEQLNEDLLSIKDEKARLIETIDAKDKDIEKIKSWNNKLSTQHQEFIENKSKESYVLSQVAISPNDNLLTIIDKFTKALNIASDKVGALEKENFYLKDKINKGSAARKDLLMSIEELRRNSQNEILKYEKQVQQYENAKKVKESELKDVTESLLRSENQKKAYINDLQTLELELYTEKQLYSALNAKYEETLYKLQMSEAKVETKNEELTKKSAKIEKLRDFKVKYTISLKEIKAIRDENSRLEKLVEARTERHQKDKSTWESEENSYLLKISALEEEINNEKTFNSIHLQEVIKLKRTIATTDVKPSKESYLEEETRLRSRISALESDLSESRENFNKLQKNTAYTTSQLTEKSRTVIELEGKLEGMIKEMSNPNYIETAEKSRMLQEREQQLAVEISKILYTFESFENAMTCIVCLKYFEEPVVLVPCGHVLCSKCKAGICPYCSQRPASHSRVQWLEQLVDKIAFQRQVLALIKSITAKPFFN